MILTEEQKKYVEENIDTAKIIARKVGWSGIPAGWNIHDLEGIGIEGLIDAAIRYKPGKALFKTYAPIRIRGSILDAVRAEYKKSSSRYVPRKDTLSEDPREEIEESYEREEILKYLELLPEQDRKILTLYYYEGLLQKEIALIVGVSAGTVCRRIRESTKEVRKVYERKNNE